jgi:hypothetical protein
LNLGYSYYKYMYSKNLVVLATMLAKEKHLRLGGGIAPRWE